MARRTSESILLALAGIFFGGLLGLGIVGAIAKAAVARGNRIGSIHDAVGLVHARLGGIAAVVVLAVLAGTVAAALLAWRAARRDARSWFWERIAILALWVCATALIVGVGSGGGAYLYYDQSVVAALAPSSKDVKATLKHLDIPVANQPATALVIGYDKRKGDLDRGRSDTVMLLRADPITNSISMLSFPRDLVVPLWCGEHQYLPDRINQAYELCGSKGTLDTIKKLTGLPINYLITVDFRGFMQVVDRVGGVWIDVDRRYFNRNVGTAGTNYANIDLRPGYQLLKGRDALSYVRYRHTDSDVYRIARQQQFVKALKQQVSSHFSILRALKVVGAITRNVEIGQAGGGSLSKAIARYAGFAYDLPSGHFFQSKIGGLTGTNELNASTEDIQAAVQDFETPDVSAPTNAAAVSFGRKAVRVKSLPPSRITVSVLNGNGVTGSATTAGYELGRRGYQVVTPANEADRNAPNYNYFHTLVYYNQRLPHAKAAGRKVADLFGDAELQRLPARFRAKSEGALLTVVVGSTFHGTLAPAPADKTPKKQPAHVRNDPAQSVSLLKSVRRKVDFRLMVPKVIERSSYIDRELPIRVYNVTKGEKAVRLTFLDGHDFSGYWGIEETTWNDAPILENPTFKHRIKGREFDFYYNGPHLHMVVLRTSKASYWVVNTLDESLSNETMIEIGKGLVPLPRR